MLADVSLRIDDGETVLVVGPNGAGKTTLLRLLATTVRPTQGRIDWLDAAGRPLPDRTAAREQLALVAHEPLVYDDLTAHENVAFLLRVRGLDAGSEVDRWLDAFGLSRRAHERVAGFSRGLRQRLALAGAFAVRPRLLLLDEPGAGLDTAGVEALVVQLRRIRGQATLLIATHDPDPLRPLASRTLEVRDGAVHDWGGAA